MGTKASKRHVRRLERLRREQAARIGYTLLWALLAAFLMVCGYFVLR